MHVLERFSESEKNYLLYEQRLEAERVAMTLNNMVKRSRAAAKQAQAETEQARKEAEQERREKERFLALLRQAGIDPDKGLPENNE